MINSSDSTSRRSFFGNAVGALMLTTGLAASQPEALARSTSPGFDQQNVSVDGFQANVQFGSSPSIYVNLTSGNTQVGRISTDDPNFFAHMSTTLDLLRRSEFVQWNESAQSLHFGQESTGSI